MVEGLVVIPFFIMIFAGIMFTGNVYEQKLLNLAEARSIAWTDSMANCNKSPNYLPAIGALEAVASGNPGTQLCNDMFNVTHGLASSKVDEYYAPFKDEPLDVQARIPRLFCNEPVQGADFQAAVGFLWSAMSPSVGSSTISVALDSHYSDPVAIDYYGYDDLYYYY